MLDEGTDREGCPILIGRRSILGVESTLSTAEQILFREGLCKEALRRCVREHTSLG